MTQPTQTPVNSHGPFYLGPFLATAGVSRELDLEDVLIALKRHQSGDWGDVCPEDRAANDAAVTDGSRLLSVYHDRKGTKFWIITEADRSATNVQLNISDVMLSLQKC